MNMHPLELHNHCIALFKSIRLFVTIAAIEAAVLLSGVSGECQIRTPLLEIVHHPIEMTFVGDVMFGRYKESGLDRNPELDVLPFDEVESLIDADVAVVNVETSLLREPPEDCPWWPVDLRFAAGPWGADALEDAGFTVATLANNHAHDMKSRGVADTVEMLRERGITVVGAGVHGEDPIKVVTEMIDGWRVGFIGFTALRNSLELSSLPPMPYIRDYRLVPEVLAPVISYARETHHIVVVLAHWGRAEQDTPLWTREVASRRLIELGADLVIGHHTHLLQGIEQYNGGLIAHSLGDFLFDKLREPNRLTGVLRIRFEPGERRPSGVRFHPVVMMRKGASIRPVSAPRIFASKVFQRLQRLSRPYGTRWKRDDRKSFEMVLEHAH